MSMRASAARYARALLDVAVTDSDPARAQEELSAVLTAIATHSDLERVLTNPVVSASAKRAILQQLCERMQMVTPARKLILLLAERDRLALLPELVAVYNEQLMEHQKVVRAEIVTAAPLAPGQLEQLQQRLARATGRTVTIAASVDAALIGGMVTRIGGTVYDGSIATQLASMRKRLVEQL